MIPLKSLSPKQWIIRQMVLFGVLIVAAIGFSLIVYNSGAAIDAKGILMSDHEIASICGDNFRISNWFWYGGHVKTIEQTNGDASLWFKCAGNKGSLLVKVDMILKNGDWVISNKRISSIHKATTVIGN